MNVNEIYKIISDLIPLDLCEDWDNSGLLVNMDNDVDRVLVTLDITKEVIREAEAKGCKLILSHHPVIFKGVKKVKRTDLISLLIKKDISAICMHTNLDSVMGGVNDVLAGIIGLNDVEIFADMGRKGTLSEPVTVRELAEKVSGALKAPVKYTLGENTVKTVALIGGSAGSSWEQALNEGIDVFLTGEVSHHNALDAMHEGMPMIAAGHYGTEIIIVKHLAETLSGKIPGVSFIGSETDRDPFSYVFETEKAEQPVFRRAARQRR
ncbi:MAG: Nif3-like dinuclear metal center hexameric protein [Lachnospiraceae bacterium]|nr:Nif3-like dinuclear metal center hexameric protein [Lachnospiraceae bacterium]